MVLGCAIHRICAGFDRHLHPAVLAKVLAEVEAGIQAREDIPLERYSVSIEEIFWRLVQKGYQPSAEDLAEMKGKRH